MSQKSNELKAQGVDVINLSVGEPDFHTPDHIKEAAKKAIDENFTFYTPVAGYMTLRKAIAAKMKNENGLDFAPEQIVVSGGAKQSLCNVILATINPGDEVVIPTPAWVSYVEMVKLAEGKTVTVPAGVEQDFKITPEQLEAAITPRTRMLLLCSPSNPTGSVYTHDELKALADVLAKYPDILVLSDEIYEHINFTGKFASISEFDAVRDRTIIVNGVSKAYAMTGWRIGFIAAPLWVAKATTKLQGQYTSNPSSTRPEGSRGRLHRLAGVRRDNAPGIRTPPRPRGEPAQRNPGSAHQPSAGRVLHFPGSVGILRQSRRRPPHQRRQRLGDVSA